MIKNIIRSSQGSHWYYPDGREAYEVPSSDGKKQIKTTVTHARKLGLYPSVTTIMKILDKPEIGNWRVERAIKASIASKRNAGERISQFIERIVEIAQSKSKTATNFGGDIHSYMEVLLVGKVFDSISIPQATKDALKEYTQKYIKSAECEKTVIGDGWAGKFDCSAILTDGRKCLYDWKTQGTKPARPFNFYKEFIIQLGTYASLGKYDCVRVLLISSTEPGRIEHREYTKAEIAWGYMIFCHLYSVFMLLNFNKPDLSAGE